MKQEDKIKFIEQNKILLYRLKDSGYYDPKDLSVVYDDKAPYNDKREAFNRILSGVNEVFTREDLPKGLKETGKKWTETYNKEINFKPDVNNWKDYDQNQMGELAESIGYNWANKDDRAQMMKNLTEYTIKKDKQDSYKKYKEEHPIAAFINENIIAPSTSKALSKGNDVETKNVIADAVNAGTYAIPGFGGIGKGATKVATALLGNAAVEEGNNILQNYANDEDLLQWQDLAAAAGVGSLAGAPDLLYKKGAKSVGDLAGNTNKSFGKAAGEKVEELAGTLMGPSRNEQKAMLNKTVKDLDKDYWDIYKAINENDMETAEKILKKNNVNSVDEFVDLHSTMKNDKMTKDIAEDRLKMLSEGKQSMSGKELLDERAKARKMLGGDIYSPAVGKAETLAKNTTRALTKGAGKTTGRQGAARNTAQEDYSPVNGIRSLIGNSDLDSYVGAKMKGYEPKIPEQYSSQKGEIDKMIKELQLKQMMLGGK